MAKVRWRTFPIVAALVASCVSLCGQSTVQLPTFSSRTDAVPLVVAVSLGGEPVTDLSAEDFEVIDNGRRAEVVAFGFPAKPVAIRVLTGLTPRMRLHQEKADALARELIDQLASDEHGAISGIGFSASGVASPFANDKLVLRSDLAAAWKWVPHDRSDWWSVLSWASAFMNASGEATASILAARRGGEPIWVNGEVPSARGLVVLSPGIDAEEGWNPREVSRDSLSRRVLLRSVTVYGFGFGGLSPDKRLAKLSAESGGRFVVPDRKIDVGVEARRLLSDLRNRYVLGFVPTAFDGAEHKLTVKVRRPGVQVLSRSVYLAPKLR